MENSPVRKSYDLFCPSDFRKNQQKNIKNIKLGFNIEKSHFPYLLAGVLRSPADKKNITKA